ncbi:SCP-2 sterol transfer family protein [Micromonospora pattaloongensis]|uniref:SCP-2 sterol transfer family protein n=1 Tax=Micromonospora pattaloongensis TaxID=405436 RepID=A0A1H3LLX1_9ACTN|nr:SCP2 sterol-binding domain-containing protein [Micromonospora pattaloongensis]SDY65537.1 SCP-2 sterol transfer family protein [Micromonospora pattaloongensis]
MASPTTELFTGIGRRGHEALLEKVQGSLRFDLEHDQQTDHWHLAISRGDVTVTQEDRPADCVVRTDQGLFDKLATGESNAIASLLRNRMTVEGNLRLLVLFERLLPGPPTARHPRPATRGRWRRDR